LVRIRLGCACRLSPPHPICYVRFNKYGNPIGACSPDRYRRARATGQAQFLLVSFHRQSLHCVPHLLQERTRGGGSVGGWEGPPCVLVPPAVWCPSAPPPRCCVPPCDGRVPCVLPPPAVGSCPVCWCPPAVLWFRPRPLLLAGGSGPLVCWCPPRCCAPLAAPRPAVLCPPAVGACCQEWSGLLANSVCFC